MHDIIAITREYVKRGPYWILESDLFEDTYRALCCEIVTPDNGDMADEGNHEEDCPWRLAKEYLENLNNPGYA